MLATPRPLAAYSFDCGRCAPRTALKAVFIVGPTNSLTQTNLTDAESLAQVAESYGMDVRRVFFPHATWENVLANIQGANLVVYMGHGYGWPSPYTKTLTESRQDGMGLNTFDGSSTSQYTYYGANVLKQYVNARAQRDRLPQPPVLFGRQRRAGYDPPDATTWPRRASTTWLRLAGDRRQDRVRLRLRSCSSRRSAA